MATEAMVMEEPCRRFEYRLPNELWLNILKEATKGRLARSVLDCMERAGSGPLEIGRLPFERLCDIWDAWSVISELSYPTRLRLALVSRTWYNLMLPILYHTVVLTTPSKLRRFATLLRLNLRARKLVKVLGINRDGHFFEKNKDTRTYIQEIYKCCPNIIAFDDYLDYGEIFSLGEEAHRDRNIQYLRVMEIHMRRDPDFFRLFSSFDQLRFLSISFDGDEYMEIFYAHKITLPRLEVLSLATSNIYKAEDDKYFGEAELPNLHTLQLTLRTTYSIEEPMSELERFKEIWKSHGHRIKTLMILDFTRPKRTPRTLAFHSLTFQINQYLTNIQQLVVNGDIYEPILAELATCSTISALEIIDIYPGYITWNSINTIQSLLDWDLYKQFGKLRQLRFSVVPDLSGRELSQSMDELKIFPSEYFASIKENGIVIISEIDGFPVGNR